MPEGCSANFVLIQFRKGEVSFVNEERQERIRGEVVGRERKKIGEREGNREGKEAMTAA